jgi:hypothetical protein
MSPPSLPPSSSPTPSSSRSELSARDAASEGSSELLTPRSPPRRTPLFPSPPSSPSVVSVALLSNLLPASVLFFGVFCLEWSAAHRFLKELPLIHRAFASVFVLWY